MLLVVCHCCHVLWGNTDCSAVVTQLAAHLPDSASRHDVLAHLRSPQFVQVQCMHHSADRQALGSFTAALHTGQLSEVLRQFGLNPEPGAVGLCNAVVAETAPAAAAAAAAAASTAPGAAGGSNEGGQDGAAPMDESQA